MVGSSTRSPRATEIRRVIFLKAEYSAVNVNDPSGTPAKRKLPSDVVTTVRGRLSDRPLNVIVTPGTTSPTGSVTVPVTTPEGA